MMINFVDAFLIHKTRVRYEISTMIILENHIYDEYFGKQRWRHDIEMLSALLSRYERNILSSVTSWKVNNEQLWFILYFESTHPT